MRNARASLCRKSGRAIFRCGRRLILSFQICQFAFYTLALSSAVISLTLMAMGVVYIQSVATLGLSVSALGLSGEPRLSLSRPGDPRPRRRAAPRAGAAARHRVPERPYPFQFARHFRSLLRQRDGLHAHPARRASAMSAAGAADRSSWRVFFCRFSPSPNRRGARRSSFLPWRGWSPSARWGSAVRFPRPRATRLRRD